MPNTNVESVYDPKYGGKPQTPVDDAYVNALLAEMAASAHSHANKALLDTYNFSNADVLDAIAKKHEPVTVAAGSPFGLTGQELSLLYDDAYLQVVGGELGVKAGDLLLGTNTNGFSKTGTGKTLGSDITLNLPQRIDTAATVRFENISIGGAYDPLYKHKVYGNANVTGNLNIDGNVVIGGNLEVAGDSVTFKVGTMKVEDKNIEMGIIDTPSDTYANGGGLILKGSTDKSWLWDSTNANWTSSEHVNVASGKSYKVNNNVVIDSSRVGFLTKLNVNGPGTVAEALNLNGNGKIWGDLYSDNSSVIEPYAGYYIGRTGSVFGKLNASEMHVKNFITDLEMVYVGGRRVTKSAAKLAADLTISGGTGTLIVEEIQGYTGHVFANGDFIGIKTQTRGASSMTVTYIWGTVVFASEDTNAGTQTYTITKTAGSGTTAAKGVIALDYGVAGNGIIEEVAIDETSNLPTLRIATFATNPWTDLTVKTQAGSLSGITTDLWGALSGFGFYSNNAYLEDDVFIGDTAVIGGRALGLLNGMTNLYHFDDNLCDVIGSNKPSYSGTFAETSYGLMTATGLAASKTYGKYGGGIAVEAGATNLITNGTFASGLTGWTNWGTGTRTVVTGYHGNGIYLESQVGTSCGISSNNISAASGTAYTIQIKVKGDSLNYWYILKASGNLQITSYTTTDIGGGWKLLSYTHTAAATETWNILYAYYNLAKGIIDEAQVEAKAYKTSFVDGTRAAGALSFNHISSSAYTYDFWAYVDLSAMQSFGRIIDISLDANNRLYLCRFSTANALQFAVITSNTVRVNLTSQALATGWHHFTLSYDGSNYRVGMDGVTVYSQASVYAAASTWTVRLGTDHAGSSFSNCIYDELAVYSRAITEKEDKQIYYSNQAFNESAGMTIISGNHIKTGIIESENYVVGVSGSMWNLNTGYLETADGWFRGTITASAGTIGGWTISSSLLGISDNVINDGYIFNLKPVDAYGRPVMEIYWANGSDLPSTGKNSVTIGGNTYLVSANGAFTATGWDASGEGGGVCINVNGKNVFMAGKRGSVVGAAIAGFMFDDKELSLSKNIGGTDYKIFRMGDFIGEPTDVATDITNTFIPEGKFNSTTHYNAWTKSGDTALMQYDATTKYEGAGSAAYIGYTGTASTMNAQWLINKSVSSIAGKTLEVSVRVRWGNLSTIASQNPVVYITFQESNFALTLWGYTYTCERTANEQWLLYTFNINIPTSVSSANIYIRASNSNSTTIHNRVNIDDFTIKEYSTTQTWISSEGFQVRSSPLTYLKMKNGLFDLAAYDINIGGHKPTLWAGKVTSLPVNTRSGLLCYMIDGYFYMYVDDAAGWRKINSAAI
jgi:hypothetical protein